MTSIVRITSKKGLEDEVIEELLNYTPEIKIEISTKNRFKLPQDTAKIIRAAIPQMVKSFERQFEIDDDYNFLILDLNNCSCLRPLNEKTWPCERYHGDYISGFNILDYVQTIISAAHRKLLGWFSSYLIYKTNDLNAVIEDLHAIALLILNLDEYSELFEEIKTQEDGPGFYRRICDIFSECILIESDEGVITRLKMPIMEPGPILVPEVFPEYKLITVFKALDQELNFEFTGKTVRQIIHTEKTLDEYLKYLSRTFVAKGDEITEMCLDDFMSNIFKFDDSETKFWPARCVSLWISSVEKSYKFVFDTICRKLKNDKATKSHLTMGKTEFDFQTFTRDIKAIISNIDVSKLPISSPITQERLFEIVLDNTVYNTVVFVPTA